jgi:hypothetical protein
MTGASLAGLLALIPAMVGPLPLDNGHPSLLLALCGGGSVEVALQREDGNLPAPPSTPCCAKGCHSAERKRLIDRGQ